MWPRSGSRRAMLGVRSHTAYGLSLNHRLGVRSALLARIASPTCEGVKLVLYKALTTGDSIRSACTGIYTQLSPRGWNLSNELYS